MAAPEKLRPEDEVLELLHLYDTAPFGLCFLDRELLYQRVNERLAMQLLPLDRRLRHGVGH